MLVRALGGGLLVGDRLLSNPVHEPFVVVAGVIVNPDKQ